MAPLNDANVASIASIMTALGCTEAEAAALHADLIGDLDGDVIHADDKPQAAPEPDDESSPPS